MNFVKIWFSGYTNPKKFIDALASKPAPQWGFYAVLLRGMLDSICYICPSPCWVGSRRRPPF